MTVASHDRTGIYASFSATVANRVPQITRNRPAKKKKKKKKSRSWKKEQTKKPKIFSLRNFSSPFTLFCKQTNFNIKMAEEDHVFETADAGSSTTYPQQCSALRKNGFVVIKGRPCKIVDMSTSKTGKHGHAKVHLVAIDIFTQKKLEDLSPSTHNMEVPFVSRTEYQLLDIDDGFLNLMTNDGETKDDVRAPEGELGEGIQAAFDEGKDLLVTIISAMGEEAAVSFKEAPK